MEVHKADRITLRNGNINSIVTLKIKRDDYNKYLTVLLDKNGTVLTPEVKSITFDPEIQLYLVRDKLAIDEYLTGSIYYYINEQGLPLGFCFSDIMHGYCMMKFNSVDDFKKNYFRFKTDIVNEIRKSIYDKYDNDVDVCKTMALYKKRVDKGEN